jgi:hypothetical protein
MDLALQAFFAALFTTIGGLVVWFVQSRAEKLRRLEESLQDRRLKLYADTIDPFIRMFAGLGDAKAQAQVLVKMKSYEYRKAVFDLTMFGSDEVVQAYNGMFQHIYKSETQGQNPREMMRLWAALLLAIRKSGGNPDTRLGEWDMLTSTIKDIEPLRNAPQSG